MIRIFMKNKCCIFTTLSTTNYSECISRSLKMVSYGIWSSYAMHVYLFNKVNILITKVLFALYELQCPSVAHSTELHCFIHTQAASLSSSSSSVTNNASILASRLKFFTSLSIYVTIVFCGIVSNFFIRIFTAETCSVWIIAWMNTSEINESWIYE